MKKTTHYLFITLASILLFTGCTTSGPYATGGGLYRVTSTGAGISAESVTENVYKAAQEYAKEKNMVMKEESINIVDGAYGRNPPSAELHFRLVPENSHEASSSTILHTGLQKVEIINGTKEKTYNRVSIEGKLEKIKTLYDNGLITEEEYKEKRKSIISKY